MTSPSTRVRRTLRSRTFTNVHRLLGLSGLMAMMSLMVGTMALTAPARTQAQDYASYASASSAFMFGHLYLYNVDGTVTDVTSTYVQTGSLYDPQKGYMVQTGYVRDATGTSIYVTVDIDGGTIGDWGGRVIGYIAP